MNSTSTVRVNVRTVTSFSDEASRSESRSAVAIDDRQLTRKSLRVGRSEDPFSSLVEQKNHPAINLFELNSQFVIEADVAGARPSELDIQASPDQILISTASAEGHVPGSPKTISYGFTHGPIEQSVRFPRHIDPETVTAEYKNGLLRIHAEIAK
ncbi:MAG: Hsp20/alpha crystallin family protein [Acidobacteriia bacterium]|nr:Hsp20/alpha crystallin family protein [Terriglobia bacterium]